MQTMNWILSRRFLLNSNVLAVARTSLAVFLFMPLSAHADTQQIHLTDALSLKSQETNDSHITFQGQFEPYREQTIVYQIVKLEGQRRRRDTIDSQCYPLQSLHQTPAAILRAGPGNYAIDVSLRPHPTRPGTACMQYGNSVSFIVRNTDTRPATLLPSHFVESENQHIVSLASELTKNLNSDREKVRAIHDWVASSISYDFDIEHAYAKTAAEVLSTRTGICREFATLFVALLRASGIPARYIEGHASSRPSVKPAPHAWSQVFYDGRWVNIDPTWDSHIYSVTTKTYTRSLHHTYFDPSESLFNKTHWNGRDDYSH